MHQRQRGKRPAAAVVIGRLIERFFMFLMLATTKPA